MAGWDQAALGLATGFLQGFVGAKNEQYAKEQKLLMTAINNAVEMGQPEALNLLNPERLAVYGLDQFLPMYSQIATKVGETKKLEQRKAQASATLAESQARLAVATEGPNIKF